MFQLSSRFVRAWQQTQLDLKIGIIFQLCLLFSYFQYFKFQFDKLIKLRLKLCKTWFSHIFQRKENFNNLLLIGEEMLEKKKSWVRNNVNLHRLIWSSFNLIIHVWSWFMVPAAHSCWNLKITRRDVQQECEVAILKKYLSSNIKQV